MQLAQITAFVLIAKHNSLAKAAHELKISPPAVSKQLSNLEAELGIVLIERTTRTLTLTDAGECFLEQCERILEEVEASVALASKLKAPAKGNLRVLATPFFASQYIFPNLNEFVELYPDIRMDLLINERIPDLHHEGIDLLMGMSIKAHGEIIQKPLLKARNMLVASPEYLEKNGTPKVPQDLITQNHRYITHHARVPDNKIVFSNKERVSLRPFLKLNGTRWIGLIAEQSLGIAMLHNYVAKERIEDGTLVEVLEEYMQNESNIYYAYPKKRFISRATRAFIDFFTDKLKDEEGYIAG